VSAAGIVWSTIFLLQKFMPVCTTLGTDPLRYSSDWISSDFVFFSRNLDVGTMKSFKQCDGNTGIYHHERGLP
jgi:hypothetical protein